jgi:hypothetical protein
MILRRVQNKRCPVCFQMQLEAIELTEGHVSSYICNSCGAHYDTEINHDFERNEHWWIGKLRNPNFWSLEMEKAIDGLKQMEMRTDKGIKEYLGRYPIERYRA